MKIQYLTNEEYLRETRQYNKLQSILDEFMKAEQPVMKIDSTGSYKNVKICYTGFYKAAKASEYPIKVRKSKQFVYLLKEDAGN